jgi:hypothetical protein
VKRVKPIVQYVITVKKVRSNMNKLEINLKNVGKTTVIMLVIAAIVATLLVFIDPIYTIILVVSGILGVFIGAKLIMSFIPDDTQEFLSNFSELIDKSRSDNLDDLKNVIDNMKNNNN